MKRFKMQWIVAASLIAAGLLALVAFVMIVHRAFSDGAAIAARTPATPAVVASGIPGGGGLLLISLLLTASGILLAFVTLYQQWRARGRGAT